jgi:3-isopropylmalate dehydrogenase
LAGKDQANPSSLIGSAAMLLRWIGERREAPQFLAAADAIEQAIKKAVTTASTRTADLGGPLGTAAFTDGLLKMIKKP